MSTMTREEAAIEHLKEYGILSPTEYTFYAGAKWEAEHGPSAEMLRIAVETLQWFADYANSDRASMALEQIAKIRAGE